MKCTCSLETASLTQQAPNDDNVLEKPSSILHLIPSPCPVLHSILNLTSISILVTSHITCWQLLTHSKHYLGKIDTCEFFI